MNDNLRNISLQYIKGENYEKITCFYSTDITKIKQILKLDYKEKNYNILEDILKKDKHEIGESLLDDLINYISFKDLKDTIKEEINVKKALLKDKKALFFVTKFSGSSTITDMLYGLDNGKK